MGNYFPFWCFNVARDLLASHKIAPADIDLVWTAIALHDNCADEERNAVSQIRSRRSNAETFARLFETLNALVNGCPSPKRSDFLIDLAGDQLARRCVEPVGRHRLCVIISDESFVH